MKKNYKLFVPCEEAQHVCDKSQYNEATLLEKIKLSIHLVFCKVCQKYTSNNRKLTKAMKNSDVKTSCAMEVNEKSNLQSMFEKELAKQQSGN
ncbi:hypothetical protein [Aquimarina agarilytica]|uniref:hypothetical protein n=1 Tax=Aquimarina agarilytica TaxID=1087449 RepID=UPI00058FBAC2|nr:hypothetical protein [Aquimarina agarilytica]